MLKQLRGRLTVIFVTLAVLPIALLGIFQAVTGINRAREDAIDSQAQSAELAGAEIKNFINSQQLQLETLVQIRRINLLEPADQRILLSSLLSANRTFEAVALLDSTGQELARYSRTEAFSADELTSRSDRPEFLQPVASESVYFSPVRFDETVREPLMTIAVPALSADNTAVDAVVVAEFRFRPVWDLVARTELPGNNADLYVTDENGVLVAHRNPSRVLRGDQIDLPDQNGEARGLSSEEVILASTRIQLGGLELIVVMERPTADAVAPVTRTARVALLITTAALLSAVILVALTVRRVVRPVERLTATARQISVGDLHAEAQVSGEDEIAQLGRSFNSMTKQLRDSIDHLEHRVAERTLDLEHVQQQTLALYSATKAMNATTKYTAILDAAALLFTENPTDLYLGMYDSVDGSTSTSLDLLASRSAQHENALAINETYPLELLPFAQDSLLVIADTEKHPNEVVREGYRKRNIRAVAAANIRLGTQTIGVLLLTSPVPHEFSEKDQDLLRSVAELMAPAIERNLRYDEQVKIADRLREVDQMKSQFLASMSHELRTPLNAILTFTELLGNGTFGDVNDEQKDYLEKSLSSGRHLLALINDVLDVTKIHAGMMKLFIEDGFDVKKELNTIVASAEKLLNDKPVKIIVDIAPDIPLMTCDKRRLRQIILNLMSNAVKFTENGSITLQVVQNDNTIQFAVIDTGPGIPADLHEVIFQPFVQTDTGIKHSQGTGLGLPISQKLTEAHGGRLWVESAPGKGAAFYAEMPLKVSQEALVKEPAR